MAIQPHEPKLGPIDFDYPYSNDNYVAPPHLVKRGPALGIDSSLTPKIDIDTSYNPSAILSTEPAPTVLPIFVGLRKAWADRQIERSNDRLYGLARKQAVLRFVGGAILSNGSYTQAKIDNQPNLNRPSTPEEIRATRKLDKIETKRRRAGSRVYATSHGLTVPAVTTRAERREAANHSREHRRVKDKVNKLDEQFRATIRKPAEDATRITSRRNRAVAKREALDQAVERRAAKMRQVRDELTGSARALGQEVAAQHQDSLDLTKEQVARLRNTTAYKSGQLAVKGTVALGKFYKEAGQNAGKLYLRGGKHVAKKTAKHASHATAKVKSRVRSKESEHSDQ